MREITTNERGMASGVVYYDADGVEHFQPAEVVILACNAVGTARILLNSASAGFPTGLANSSGLVGKNLMFHPYARIAGYFDEKITYRLSENSRRMLDHSVTRATEILRAAGAYDVWHEAPILEVGGI